MGVPEVTRHLIQESGRHLFCSSLLAMLKSARTEWMMASDMYNQDLSHISCLLFI
jgi:hypothetical protein